MRSTLVAMIMMLSACPGPDSDPSALVGTWNEVQTSVATTPPDVLVVNADHTYRLDKSTGTQTGTYDADGDTLTIRAVTGTTAHSLVEGYVIDGDQMLTGALLPMGSVSGLVGQWHGDFEIDQDAITLDLDVRADGSVHYARTSTKDGSQAADGTWSEAGGDFITTLQASPQPVALHWKAISGRAIGNPMYARGH